MLRTIDRSLTFVSLLLVALFVVLLFTGPGPIGTHPSGGYSAGVTSDARSGAALFQSAGCASCHTLKAAGAIGTTGPNLDRARPSASRVRSIVASGGGGMPSFSGKLSRRQIAALARYVSDAAGDRAGPSREHGHQGGGR